MLVVIAIIVVLLGLAVVSLSFITGSKSIDGATNQISAFLGRARMEAIGLQQARGVLFFIDPGTDRVTLAMVREVPAPTGTGDDYIHNVNDVNLKGTDDVGIYLDLVVDTDFLTLPPGVRAQFVDNAAFDASGRRTDDGYVGFNDRGRQGSTNTTVVALPRPSTPRIGGVILFDGNGRMISRSYAFRTRTPTGGTTYRATDAGRFIYPESVAGNPDPAKLADFIPWNIAANMPPRSQFGLVLFDRQAFDNQGFTERDPQHDGSAGIYNAASAEFTEERWLDDNASPVLVNRYNGTLVRGSE